MPVGETKGRPDPSACLRRLRVHGGSSLRHQLPRQRFLGSKSYQAASASLYDQVWMTGWRFTSSMPAIMRSLRSCFEVTRMWRRTDRANLEKKPSMRLSHEPCLGVKVNSKRPGGRASSQAVVSLDMCAMIIEDQLDRGAGRISGVETLEEFDELPAAVAVSDERMDLSGKRVDSGQQAQRAMTFVLVIPREGRVDARLGRQIGCCGCDGLDSRLRRRKRSPLA